MTTRFITSYEIAEKQQSIINDYQQSQTRISFSGIRRLAGSTFIAIGERIQGCREQHQEQTRRPVVIAPARGI